MRTKYLDVHGHATFCHFLGPTTLPGVPPDLSRGRKVILIHGAGGNGNTWHYQIESLAPKHSPIALDLPGHGRSSGVEGLMSIRDYSEFLAHFMDTLGIDSAVLAGWSMGGAIALAFAARFPGMASRLLLIGTTPCLIQRPDWPHAVPPAAAEQLGQVLASDYGTGIEMFCSMMFP